MANQSIINNSKLDAIVAAIVAKGGGTAPMTADQMAAAIAAIPTGGGGTDQIDKLVCMKSLPHYVCHEETTVSEIKAYAFQSITTLEDADFSGVTGAAKIKVNSGAFKGCTALKHVLWPAGSDLLLKMDAFNGCTCLGDDTNGIVSGRFSEVGSSCFTQCTHMTEFISTGGAQDAAQLPISGNAFQACRNLKTVDLSLAPKFAYTGVFSSCIALEKLIIRDTTQVGIMSSSGAFSNCTPLTGKTARIYVPDALVEDYKAATNWATYADIIYGLSELPTA